MAEVRLRSFDTMAAFNAAKSGLPYPCIATIKEQNDLFVWYRHDSASKPDNMYTVGKSRIHVGYSVLGSESRLGTQKNATQVVIQSIINQPI